MNINEPLQSRLLDRLKSLYGDQAGKCLRRIVARMEEATQALSSQANAKQREHLWDQRDIVLITYGDQVRRQGATALSALKAYLERVGLNRLINTIHVLPFFPYSSDDGFSVIDYRQVDPALGDWTDIAALREDYDLMFDLVINHVSSKSRWFEQYKRGEAPYTRFFIEEDANRDLSMVTRPRSLPLLTPVDTSRGTRHVWTTFSEDQIDLNFAEPDVLVAMIDVLLFYLEQGARIIRLDAIAYLWKEADTSCIHLPQTHTVVKLMREIVDAVAPGTILLTETNVPHQENVSYFGDGDEAQMVYQFSLAPLLLETFLSGDATILTKWLRELQPTPPGTTVFNFTASHDGIGVRPLEGIMPPERFEHLIEAVQARGGHVSTKRNPDFSESPYELNLTYFSALADLYESDMARSLDRFLATQVLMLAMKGIPGIYFHSLVGTPNHEEGVVATGRARSINRRKFDWPELVPIDKEVAEGLAALAAPTSMSPNVLKAYCRWLSVRIEQAAFHPDASQQVLDLPDPCLVGFWRVSLDGAQRILVLGNVGSQARTIDLRQFISQAKPCDVCTGLPVGDSLVLGACNVVWLDVS